MRGNWSLTEQRRHRVEARPVMNALDEEILDRVRCRVDELVDDIGALDKMNDADLFAGPKVLPATAQGVLSLGEHLVEVLDELDDVSVAVEDVGVVVVGHRLGQQDLDAEPLRGLRKAVGERVVGLGVRAQQKLSLGAATSDHVEASSNDLTRERHRDRPDAGSLPLQRT